MREVWIRPQHAPVLLKVEKLLRKPNAHPLIHALKGVTAAMTTGPVSTHTLLANLQSSNGPLQSLNNACAPVVLDAQNTLLLLGGSVGLVALPTGAAGLLAILPK